MQLSAHSGRFLLDGRPFFPAYGEMHYFRIDPSLWAQSIERLKEAGLNGISTYIPWVWHEPEEGHPDFDGKTHPSRDLCGFLRACRQAGMGVLVRPGPFIYAEYNGLGHPLWLGRDYPDTVVKDSRGNPVAGEFWFSHALGHPLYREKVAKWYNHVIKALEPYFENPVVGLQVDNETALMYGYSPGAIDWNPDTVTRFQTWLSERYSTPAGLNGAWSTTYRVFGDIMPPLPPFNQAHVNDWQLFLESWVNDYLVWLAAITREQTQLPLFINEQATFSSPANSRQKSVITDFYGYDCYLKSSKTQFATDYPFLNAVAADVFGLFTRPSSPLFSAELGVGWFDPRSIVPESAVIQNMLGAVAHGLRGMCLYTVHDCVETTGQKYCYHSILDKSGAPDSKYAVVKALMDFMRENGDLLICSERVSDSVATIFYQPSHRVSTEDYLAGGRLLNPSRFLLSQGLYGTHALLMSAGFSPAMVDLETASVDDLLQYKVLVFTTLGHIDAESYRKLLAYVEAGGTLVTLPAHPHSDLSGKPLDTTALYPAPETGRRYPGRNRLLLRILTRWKIHYRWLIRPRLVKNHLYSMHLIDLFEPALVLITAGLKPVWALDANRQAIRGDLQATGFVPRGDARVLLRHARSGEVCGYSISLGKGRSVVLGTIPGGSFNLPGFHTLFEEELKGLGRFIRELLAESGVTPRTKSELPVEVAYRSTENRTFVFLINRGRRRYGVIRPEGELCPGSPKILFNYGGSTVKSEKSGELRVDLRPDDIVVLGYERA